MMGTTHAATGLLAGVAVATLAGGHGSDLFICGAVGAGAALLPDLDAPRSTIGQSLGPVTDRTARLLAAASRATYRATGTARDLAEGRDGGHRYLTHTLPAAAAAGVLAGLIALHPWGAALVVGALAALGLGCIWREIGGESRRDAASTVAVVAVGMALATVVLPGGAPWLIGLTTAVGALVHILGDWLTRHGVPLAWPLTYRGKRWWLFRSPLPFLTGPESVQEKWIRAGSLVGAPALAIVSHVAG